MTNYTKTTNFATKDTLPSGNANKIVKGTEIDTEFNNIATAVATKADTAGPTLTGTTTFETLSDGSISITAFVDEDNMASDSATLLPTQQSVKAYVDSQVTAQDLDFQADSGGALSIDLDSETLTFTGGTGIDTSGSGNAVTFAIDSTVATLTGSQTLSNKTLATPVVSGNLTTNGLIDGRDVATDGTKLDGIEASADVTDTANVTAAGALMDSELTNITAVKALNQGVATTDSPTFAGLTTTADVSFADNAKAIFGAGSDLQIYHDGGNTFINEGGTGSLYIQARDLFLRDYDTSVSFINMLNNGAVTLHHAGNAKLATTSTGIDVTGTVTADGLTVDGVGSVSANTTSNAGSIYNANTSGTVLKLRSGSVGGTTAVLGIFDGNNNEKARFTASGRLGINTTSPAVPLHVHADGTGLRLQGVSPDTNGAILDFYNSSGSRRGLVGFIGSGTTMMVSNDESGPLAFQTANTERMRLTATGLGIGTTSPYASLTVDTANGILNIANGNTSGGTKIQAWGATPSDGYLVIEGYTKEYMRLDLNGNLLVGNTIANPASGFSNQKGFGCTNSTGKVEIATTANDAAIEIGKNNANDGSLVVFRKQSTAVGSIGTVAGDIVIGTGACGIRFHDGTPALQPRNTDGSANNDAIDIGLTGNRFKDLFLSGAAASGTSSNYLRFLHDGGNGIIDNTAGSLVFRRSGSFTESMRIDSSGNLLVGTTTSSSPASGVVITPSFTSANASGIGISHPNGTSSGAVYNYFFYNSTGIGSITQNGTTGVLYNTSSDYRLKDNIVDAPSASDDIDAIQVRSFDWKADGSHQKYGMVAQELQGVAPEAVSIPDDPEEMAGVDYSKLVPMLVKEIQSLRARVQQLENN